MNTTRGGLRMAALAAVLAVPVGGCGRSSPAPAASASPPASAPAPKIEVATPKACAVLTEAIAKKYLGAGAQLRRDVQTNAQMSQCQYGDDKGIITIMVGPWSMVHNANPMNKPVAGLGDEASAGPGGLDVRKGDRGVNIGVMVMSGEFWGKAADDAEAQMANAEIKVAPDLLARL